MSDLLEDFDGAPFPEDVQRAVRVREADLLAELDRMAARLAEALPQRDNLAKQGGDLLESLTEAYAERDAALLQAERVTRLWHLTEDERDRAEAKRDAVSKSAREVLDIFPDYEELDPLRRVLGMPLWDSPEGWEARGRSLAEHDALVFELCPSCGEPWGDLRHVVM